jgi:PAS domain S-box-containing protein
MVSSAMADQDELSSRVQRLEAILSSLHRTPVAVFDRGGTVQSVWMPQEYADRYGFGEAMREGLHVSDLIQPQEAEEAEARLREVFDSGEPAGLIRSLRFPGGRYWLDLRLSPLRTPAGETEGVIVVAWDITEQKQAEETLRSSEENLRAILSGLHETPIAVFDREARLLSLWTAHQLENHYGVGAATVVGQRLHDIVDPAAADRVCAAIREVFATGEPQRAEHRFGVSEREFVHDVSFAPIRGEDGEVRSVLSVSRDVTDLKRAQSALIEHRYQLEALVEQRTAELERSHQELRRSERLAVIGTFAAGIAHQINNPVGGILLAAQFALETGVESPRVQEALRDIVKECERCGRVAHNILRFAREEAWDKAPADLNAVVRAAAEDVRGNGLDGGVTLELELGEPVPFVALNETAIREVVVNLIRNAVEAGSQRVVVRTQATSDGATVAVMDDGHGIAPHHRSRVFDPFYTTHRREGGTGLGLSIAHAIVVDHLGSFEVESEPGHGTTIKVNLPRTLQPTRSAGGERR